jgi:hypothetical protein
MGVKSLAVRFARPLRRETFVSPKSEISPLDLGKAATFRFPHEAVNADAQGQQEHPGRGKGGQNP